MALIREGIALHDQQNYDAAIERYKKVLDENPWDARALHELSYSYFESKRYEEALATGLKGAQCRSDGLPGFHILIGNALDMLGRNRESIEVYKAAIKQNPRVSLLHYNLALALNAGGKKAKAKKAVENALRLSPAHASSHALLGSIYADMGYQIPAILAYSRFLMLEPASQRAKGVAPRLSGLLTGNVTYGKEPNHINITLSEPSRKHADEGDFMAAQMALSIAVAAKYTLKPEKPEEEAETKFEKLVSVYGAVCESFENAPPGRGFAATYYAPFFAALNKAGHTEAFVARAWTASGLEGAADWVKDNGDRMSAFAQWAQSFNWPAK